MRAQQTALGNHLTFAAALLGTNLKAALVQRAAFAMQVVFMALNNVAFFVFWWALMGRVDQIRGWHLADIKVLFGIVAVGFGLAVTLAGGVRHLNRFITDGELDTLLTQPRPVLAYALGLRLQPSGAGDVLSGIGFVIWSGHLSWQQWLAVLVAALASAVILVACGVVFFSLAFWLGSVETFARQLWDLLITFSLYPEPLFGGGLRVVLFTVLPAGLVGYLPARLVNEPSLTAGLLLVTTAIGYMAIAVVVFERGLRRYASGSRFGTFG
jgi:ABC-2 type transport system permease protein